MSVSDRRQNIVEVVRQEGFVSIELLARRYAVTPQTIRRDINEMADQGLLVRYHGGAGLPSSVENVAYDTRRILCFEEKQRIAALVARHIPNYASLFINIGTTTEAVAKGLTDHIGLRVITNNLNVVSTLSRNQDCEIIVTGGLVRSRDKGVVGEAALSMITQFKVDIGVIGISGIDLDGALLDYDYREVQVAKAIIAHSRRVFLVADHTKVERNALVRLGDVSQLDAWFTDQPPPRQLAEVLAEAGTEVHIAD